ncbi:MAG: TfoX/Sxy family protein [Leptolyngbyaceae cyanobacterium RU_5_1]|nr:TfoX/Sxy family protein [Leptolyngbyaceae cyanobacterium RU_5_1]
MSEHKTLFRDSVLERLNQVGAITARAMFGGYGLYMEGIMFALIAYDRLYLKVDDDNRNDFIAAGMFPFTYDRKHKPIQMSYYQLPANVLDDVAMLAAWVEKAHAAARRAKAKQKPKRSASFYGE